MSSLQNIQTIVPAPPCTDFPSAEILHQFHFLLWLVFISCTLHRFPFRRKIYLLLRDFVGFPIYCFYCSPPSHSLCLLCIKRNRPLSSWGIFSLSMKKNILIKGRFFEVRIWYNWTISKGKYFTDQEAGKPNIWVLRQFVKRKRKKIEVVSRILVPSLCSKSSREKLMHFSRFPSLWLFQMGNTCQLCLPLLDATKYHQLIHLCKGEILFNELCFFPNTFQTPLLHSFKLDRQKNWILKESLSNAV